MKEKPTKKSRICIHSHGVIEVYGGRDGNHLRGSYVVPSSRYRTFVSYVSGTPGRKKDFVLSFRPLLCSSPRFEIHNVRTTDINTDKCIEVYGYFLFNSDWF